MTNEKQNDKQNDKRDDRAPIARVELGARCICKIATLMNRGCQCGSIKPYKIPR